MPDVRKIQCLLDRARARWRRVSLARAVTRAALAGCGIVALAALAAMASAASVTGLALVAALTMVVSLGAIGWAAWPLRHVPSDSRVARFIEEGVPELEDRLATAVDALARPSGEAPSAMAAAMLADAATRAEGVDLDRVVAPATMHRALRQAGGALFALLVVLVAASGPARRALDAVLLEWWPARATLEVRPGDARVRAGTDVTVVASLAGNRAPVQPVFERRTPDGWAPTPMTRMPDGRYQVALGAVTESFQYRVVAARVVSRTYDIQARHPPRVRRIDVEYVFPPALGLLPRVEEDGGDVYAPVGTMVTLRVHAERATRGELRATGAAPAPLRTDAPNVFSTALQVSGDASYRIAVVDAEGLEGGGDTEYFIRPVEDRPPDVRVVEPAADRRVTRLEEVDIVAQATDDHGVDRIDLVYGVRGGVERTVPLARGARATTVTGRYTLALEGLDVKPGDLVSYYVTARDQSRGARAVTARSDLFFLDVRPFEQEFTLAQSQAMAGAGSQASIDDLVTAQKAVVVSTWKLDRRSDAARGARSGEDIRAVARAETELRTRVEQAAGTFRQGVMRDPRRSGQNRSRTGAAPGGVPAGTPLAEEDAMAAAATAMGQAATALNELKTAAAVGPEMEALHQLLEAQAAVTRRQITRSQQAGGGADTNRNLDLSSLFDRELQRTQQNNYETPSSNERRSEAGPRSALDAIKELARRQDELSRRQKALEEAQAKLSESERARQLDRLTRDQLELRQRAEALATQTSAAGSSSTDDRQPASGAKPSDDPRRASQLRGAAEAMRNAASSLRQQNLGQAGRESARALERLRDAERQSAPPRELTADAAKKVAGQLARAQALRQALDDTARQMARLGAAPRPSGPQAPGESGRTGLERPEGTSGGEVARAREQARQSLQQTRELLDDLRRDDPSGGQRGAGLTFEGQGMATSAPGTEAFKQDVSRWDDLRRQASAALDRAERDLSAKLRASRSQNRLASGLDDRAPASYQQQVDSYFKALATRKPPR